MNIPVILAHGEHMVGALTFMLLAGGSSVVCVFIAVVLYLADKYQTRRLRIVGIIWMMAVVLSIMIAALVDRS